MGLLGMFRSALPKLSDAQEQHIAQNGSERQRVALAGNERTSQDILYYLALHDQSAKVRKAIAGNPSTPMQAVSLLAKDRQQDVRIVLARRLVKILPALSEEKYSQLYAYAVQSLAMLALDEVLKVRKALAETLKDHALTPPDVALQLAKDLEREVSEPILRFCVALSDDHLIEILKTHPANWAAEAVASRRNLSPRVSEAVIDTGNVRAGKMLIANEGAALTPDLFETIVERAREYPEWHRPLALRRSLPPLMAQKLAAYVDNSIRKILAERSDLDPATIYEIGLLVKRRVAFEAVEPKTVSREKPEERARALFAAGAITEDILSDAIAMRDRAFVLHALALRAATTYDNVEKVFDVKAPKAICAVTWRAGYSMRLALKLQQGLGGVKPAALIYPRGGTDYPLSEEELRWQLGVIGIG